MALAFRFPSLISFFVSISVSTVVSSLVMGAVIISSSSSSSSAVASSSFFSNTRGGVEVTSLVSSK